VYTIEEKFLLYRILFFKDEKAFEKLYQKYSPAIRRFLSIKLPESEIDDALSMVFIRLWNYLTGTKVESVSGISFTIARGVIAEYYRQRRPQELVDDWSQVPASKSVYEKTIRDQEKQQAKIDVVFLQEKVLSQLHESDQIIIILRYLEDLSIREIARRLQKSEGATRTHLHRALKTLREILDEQTKAHEEK